MLNAKNIPTAIQWHEGMLLTPQHFQQLALRQEALLQYSSMLTAPYYWGVRGFEIDKLLLVSGKFRVLELEAVMPDGGVALQGPDQGSLELDLVPYKDQVSQGPLTVFLAVPPHKSGFIKGDLARYESIEGEPVPDQNTGNGEVRIPRLRPRLTLLLSDEPPAKYVSLPLARVQYRDETYSTTEFSPPTPFVLRGSMIHNLCKEVAERIREKAVSLSERTSASSAGISAPQVSGTRHAVHCLVAGLPHFEAVLNTEYCHPYVLYLSLCNLVGHLASLGRGLVPPALPPYNHCDLVNSFRLARNFVLQMVREGIPESHTGYPLKLEDDIFSVFLEADWLNRPLVLEMRSRPGIPTQDLVSWGEQCLIASRPNIQSLRQKRVLGTARHRIESQEELFPTPGSVLFSLTADPESLVGNELLHILNRGEGLRAARPTEIVLYVRNKPS